MPRTALLCISGMKECSLRSTPHWRHGKTAKVVWMDSNKPRPYNILKRFSRREKNGLRLDLFTDGSKVHSWVGGEVYSKELEFCEFLQITVVFFRRNRWPHMRLSHLVWIRIRALSFHFRQHGRVLSMPLIICKLNIYESSSISMLT